MAETDSIDEERLEKAINWFARYIAVQQGGRDVDFYSGYMQMHEGFKRELFRNGHDALRLETWDKSMIGSGRILDCVVAGLQSKDGSGQNIVVNFHSVTNFKEKANTDLPLAEDVLFNLYEGDDDATAFEDACDFFGRWYPVFSYLMFLKDDTKYLPVKSSSQLHGDRFRKLNIDRDCLRYCSWNNYQVFLNVHRQIQEKLIEAFPENQISLLDAHSFVWTLYAAPDDFSFKMEEKLEKIPGATDFVNQVADQLKYREKAQQEDEDLERSLEKSGIEGRERVAMIKARLNQSEFRKRLLLRYKKCCLCGASDPRLMTASHIKPWSESEPAERVDPDNGFLLCPNHDALFDQFLISFDDDGKIMISDSLSSNDRIFMNIREDMKVSLREGNKKYLEYHRNRFSELKH
ncbi:HNH endonuclease [Butyrivibrio sp. FCS014]|uniref:HNH endonuclease n=1 Tax=Butyrivibrio sp. FCS014 TaxID=1408304 RepID=UPI000464243F|nr:HNH endonuclease signature motif containing protein [Butyrivibrio sp. FCS014]